MQAVEDLASVLTVVCGASVRRFVKTSTDDIESPTEPTSARDIVKKCMERIIKDNERMDCTTESLLKACLWMVLPKPRQSSSKKIKSTTDPLDGTRDSTNGKIRSLVVHHAYQDYSKLTQ